MLDYKQAKIKPFPAMGIILLDLLDGLVLVAAITAMIYIILGV